MSQEIYTTKNFRVMPIVSIKANKETNWAELNMKNASEYFEVNPITDGVAIEYKIDNTHCVVIAFVYPEEDQSYSYQPVGTRIEDYCTTWTKILEFRTCLSAAYEAITEAALQSETIERGES